MDLMERMKGVGCGNGVAEEPAHHWARDEAGDGSPSHDHNEAGEAKAFWRGFLSPKAESLVAAGSLPGL